MIYPVDFPENGTIIEWSEKQQTFFMNEIVDKQSAHLVNKNGITAVYIARNGDEALALMKMVESLIKTRGSIGHERSLSARQINLLIKKLVAFSAQHSRIVKKK